MSSIVNRRDASSPGGCYSISVVPRSGVCREARDGACVRYAEENKTDRTSTEVVRAGTGDTCIQETTSGTPDSTKCKAGKCDVTIGGNPYCSQCSEPSDHLVDGSAWQQMEKINVHLNLVQPMARVRLVLRGIFYTEEGATK